MQNARLGSDEYQLCRSSFWLSCNLNSPPSALEAGTVPRFWYFRSWSEYVVYGDPPHAHIWNPAGILMAAQPACLNLLTVRSLTQTQSEEHSSWNEGLARTRLDYKGSFPAPITYKPRICCSECSITTVIWIQCKTSTTSRGYNDSFLKNKKCPALLSEGDSRRGYLYIFVAARWVSRTGAETLASRWRHKRGRQYQKMT